MATTTASPPEGPEPSPLTARRSHARGVANDLEAIFGAAPVAAEPPPRAVPDRGRPHPAAPRSRLPMAGALASAAFLGLAAGAFFVTRTDRPAPRAAARPPLRVELAQATPAPQPGPIDPFASSGATPAPSAAVTPSVRTGGTPLQRLSRPGRPSRIGVDLFAADRRLRTAYSAAVRAGAPRSEILDIRNRWEAIRIGRAHNPRALAAGYAALTVQLQRATAYAERRADNRHSRVRWPGAPRYAPWWS